MRTAREQPASTFQIETQVRSFVSDPARLRALGFASQEAFFAAIGLDGSTVRRDLRKGALSLPTLKKMLSVIASPAETEALLARQESRGSQRRLSRVSMSRVLAIRQDDRKAWFSFVNDICVLHRIGIPTSTEEIVKVVNDLIIPARNDGEYARASFYALSFLMWLINTRPFRKEAFSTLSLLATQFGRAAGQMESYSLHHRAAALTRSLTEISPHDPGLVRLRLDTEAQCISTYSRSRGMLKKASNIHEHEAEVAKQIIFNADHCFIVDDDYFSCVETYYNKMQLKFRLFGHRQIADDFLQYQEILVRAREYCVSFPWSFRIDDISTEVAIVADLFAANILIEQCKFDLALAQCEKIQSTRTINFEMKKKLDGTLDRIRFLTRGPPIRTYN